MMKKIKKPHFPDITKKSAAAQLKQLTSKKPEEPPVAEPVPRITNESIAEHREEVLSSARKYIYPLRHSKNRIVKISITLFLVAIIASFVGCVVELYKLQSTSTFMYAITKVLPFPVARAHSSFVSYDSYLFELRHYMHYYQSQQGVNFATNDGKRQLASFKQRSLQQAVDQAYVKQLASKNHVSVSAKEIDNEVELVRSQNRLGASNAVFQNVLKQFWGWSVSDFRRELGNELLAQKVVAKLDTATTARANDTLKQLNAGGNFEQLAAQSSDDAATKANGGQYGFTIDHSSPDVTPQAVAALYKLKPNEYSTVINSGYFLEIDKLLTEQGGKLTAEHITFSFKDINTYLVPEKAKHPTRYYLHL